jgi:hypothetical protein
MDRANGNANPILMLLGRVATLMKAHTTWTKSMDQDFLNGKVAILTLAITIWTSVRATVLCDGQMEVCIWVCGRVEYKVESVL